MARVDIEVLSSPTVNHALTHNRVPFLRRVSLAIPATEAPLTATLRLTVLDPYGQEIARPWSQEVRLEPGEPLVLDDPQLALDPAIVSTVEEATRTEIRVTLENATGIVATSYTPLTLLAATQWSLDPTTPLQSLRMLAAFVQPNHPAVAELLPRVSERLLATTKSASLGVENVGPERVDAIVRAVVETVAEQGIAYALPPASWGLGQKIRTPGDVLAAHAGTCLDLTLLVAAVLEHLGVAPVVWVAVGHAFVGWWRGENLGLPDAASLQIMSAVNAVDLELLGVLEATALTRERRPPSDLFRRACQLPKDSYFRGNVADLVGVVDIAQSRLVGTLPLPARRLRADGVVEVVDYQPPSITIGTSAPVAVGGVVRQPAPAEPVPPRVRAWQHALLDLSLRNPLLNLTIGLTELPLAIPDGALGAFAELLGNGDAITLRSIDDLPDGVPRSGALPGDVARSLLQKNRIVFSLADVVRHDRVVERLRYRARTSLQESGANLLTLTFGRLDWTLGDKQLSSPLLIAPAELRGVLGPPKLALDPAGQMTLNLSLVEKLRMEFGLTIPALAELPVVAETGLVDVPEVLRRVRSAIADAGLPMRVDADARLAIIAFTGYLLWRDLENHWEELLTAPLARHLALTPTDPYVDAGTPDPATLDEIVAAAPIPLDGSQAQAVAAARAGRSFVLEGPPGTGKSQTITNLIADQVTRGRSVLFVAEKGAALEVVRSRLESVGLLPFMLDLHDRNARPLAVRKQLKRALAYVPEVDTTTYGIAAGDTRSAGTVLADYAGQLHEQNAAGLSLYGAHELRLARGDGPALDVPADAGDLREAVLAAVPDLNRLGPDTWRHWGFASAGDMAGILATLAAADRAITHVHTSLSTEAPDLAATVRGAGALRELGDLARLLSADSADPARLQVVLSDAWRSAEADLDARTNRLTQSAARVLAVCRPEVVLVPLAPVRQSLREAAASFFIGRKGRLLRAAQPVLEHLRPGVQIAPKELPALVEELVGIAQEAQRLADGWQSLLLSPVLPRPLNVLDPDHLAAIAQARAMLKDDAVRFAGLPYQSVARLSRTRGEGLVLRPETQAALTGALVALDAVADSATSREPDQREWAGESLLDTWAATAPGRAASTGDLATWLDVRRRLAPVHEASPTAEWTLLRREVLAEDAVAALERGVAQASEVERLAAGGFGHFDGERQDRTVDRFVAASRQLRESLKSAIPAAVVERRPFQPGRMFGTVAALERAVGRTKGGLSVRQLMEQYGSVILEVTPCVLVSPDSLARFIPPGSARFDLVVFDEASQITVPDAIGAIGRGRSVLIAGDSQQMPPTSFLNVTQNEEDLAADFQVLPDEESILTEAVMTQVPRLWLSWHYRSRDESLIAFSNEQYYDNRLLTFPAVPGRGHDSGVTFHRVQGQFIRSGADQGALRTNPAEAAAVVDEVLRRWRAGERSLGVVTFNIQQRALIERMLIDSGDADLASALLARDDGIFVKNLENVQGDEREVVIFSTGFSAGANGVLPLNFGPLNRSGGERRLNVAVTRARRRVMVFSSFEPEDLRVDETSSVGIAHLRRYLELAKNGTGTLGRGVVTVRADRHRDQIAERLRERGLAVEVGLGLSEFSIDLAVGLPGEPPTLAVLLDSPQWARRLTVTDRDALPESVLEGVLGWPGIARVWLPEWLASPDVVLDRLMTARQESVDRPHTIEENLVTWHTATWETDDESTEEPEGTPDQIEAAETQGSVQLVDDPVGLNGQRLVRAEFVPFQIRLLGRSGQLDTPRARPVLSALMIEIIETEGPISLPRLCRLVAGCYGLTRSGPQRLDALAPLVPNTYRRDPEGFVYPQEIDPLRWHGYRVTAGPAKERPLDDVSLVEIGNAAVDIATTAMGIEAEELLRETWRVFGGTRVTATVRPRLEAAVAAMLHAGRLVVRAGIYSGR